VNAMQRMDFRFSSAVAALFIALPWATSDDGILFLASLIMVWVVFALGYNVAFGLTGILSFGHAAFFGLGAYGMTWAQMHWGLSFWMGLPIAGVFGATAAGMFGWIGRRVTGLFFALLTLLLSELISILLLTRLRGISGGEDGIPGVPRPEFSSWDFYDNAVFYWVILLVFLAALLFCKMLRSSPLGCALQGVRQNSVRAEQLGFNVTRLRLMALGISGFLSGASGGLLAVLMMYTSPQLLHWKSSGDIVIMTLLGGSGTLLGSILGVAFFEILREILSSYSNYWYGLVGIVFIACTLFLRQGLAGLLLKRWATS